MPCDLSHSSRFVSLVDTNRTCRGDLPAMRVYFLGSNAVHVVRYAKCSVLVVPH